MTIAAGLDSSKPKARLYAEAAKDWKDVISDESRRGRQACAQCILFIENLESCKPNDKVGKTLQDSNKHKYKLTLNEFFVHTNAPDHDSGTLLVKTGDNAIVDKLLANLLADPMLGRLSSTSILPSQDYSDEDEDSKEPLPSVLDEKHINNQHQLTSQKLLQMAAQADKDGAEVTRWDIPFPLAGRPSMGASPLQSYCDRRSSVLNKGDLVLCKVDSTSTEPVNVCKVVKIVKYKGEFFAQMHYYGDGKNSFLGKYQPLHEVVEGKPTGSAIQETYPLSIDGFSLILIDWGFSLRTNPSHTLPTKVVTLLQTDIRQFIDKPEHTQAIKAYLTHGTRSKRQKTT